MTFTPDEQIKILTKERDQLLVERNLHRDGTAGLVQICGRLALLLAQAREELPWDGHEPLAREIDTALGKVMADGPEPQ